MSDPSVDPTIVPPDVARLAEQVAERTDAGGDLLPFAVADRYGVLFDPDRWRDFVAALPADARTVDRKSVV